MHSKKKDKEKMIKEIRRAQIDIKTAENYFQFVTDPELVDVAIYELEAKKSKYEYLIRMAKQNGVRITLKESLVECLAK